MISKIKTKLFFLSLSIFVIFIDQFTKYIIFYNYKLFINKDFLLFRLDIVKNYGAAFNIFSGSRILLSLISIIFSIFLIYLIFKKKTLSNKDIIILLKGAHGFEVKKNCKFIEVKQGPFFGLKDKKKF